MAVEERLVWGFRCERCGYEWVPRKVVTEPPEPFPVESLPTVCPKCKNVRWNRPRQEDSVDSRHDTDQGEIP